MTRFIAHIFFLQFLLFAIQSAYGQNGNREKIDSLLTLSFNTKDPLKKSNFYLEIAELNAPNALDSVVFYAKKACGSISWPKQPTNEEKKAIKGLFARANNDIGYAYSIQGRNIESISHYNKAQRLFKELNDYEAVAKTLNNIGVLYKHAGNYEAAKNLYLEGLGMLKGTKDSLGIAMFENNLAATYKNLGENEKAISHYRISEKIRRRLNDKNGLASTLNNMGVFYKDMNNMDSAAVCFKESLAIVKASNNLQGITHAGINLAEVELIRANYDTALKLASESMEAAKTINSIPAIINAAELLTKIYHRERNFEKAFEMQEIYIEYLDKVNKEELNRELIKTEVKGDYDKKVALSQKENEKKVAIAQKQKENQQAILFGSILLTIIVLVFIFVLVKRLKSTRQQSRTIEKQNNERKILLQEIHHRVKNNFQIISSLLKLQTYSEDDPVVEKAFNGAISRIHAMSIVHEIIYKQDTFSGLSTRSYLNSLIEQLKNSFDYESVELEVVSVEDSLAIEQFIPIGIIINELITNSFKHAFTENSIEPKISIDLNKQGNEFILIYKDNGVGCIQSKIRESFGMGLIETMVDQLSGKMEVSTSEYWTTVFAIQFEKNTIS